MGWERKNGSRVNDLKETQAGINREEEKERDRKREKKKEDSIL
tara:strand:- start:487 stop:615 length:129 start_codon:yes stop_codon:yes gene_type:complete